MTDGTRKRKLDVPAGSLTNLRMGDARPDSVKDKVRAQWWWRDVDAIVRDCVVEVDGLVPSHGTADTANSGKVERC